MQNLYEKIILVTGGTGFIGKPLCEVLARYGARVFVLTRSKGHISTDKICYVSTLTDLKGLSPDIIINLAGEPIAQRWSAAAKNKILRSRVETTAAIINYIRVAAKKPSLLISGSAIGYYGTDKEIEFTENTPPVIGNAPFAQSLCAAWENEAAKAESYGVRTAFLRIGAVLGKDGGMLKKLLPLFRLGLGGPLGNGQQWLSWIDRCDLINLILHIINTPTIKGAINATAPHPLSNQYFSEALAKILHKPCLLRTPAFLLQFAFGDMANEIMIEGQKVLPGKAIETGFVFAYPTLALSLQKIFTAGKAENG